MPFFGKELMVWVFDPCACNRSPFRGVARATGLRRHAQVRRSLALGWPGGSLAKWPVLALAWFRKTTAATGERWKTTSCSCLVCLFRTCVPADPGRVTQPDSSHHGPRALPRRSTAEISPVAQIWRRCRLQIGTKAARRRLMYGLCPRLESSA